MKKERGDADEDDGLESRFDPKSYNYTCIFEFNGQTDLSPYIHLSAKGICPTVKISHHLINFGDCKVHERKDFMVTLDNKNDDHPVDYNFSSVSEYFGFFFLYKNRLLISKWILGRENSYLEMLNL